MTEMYSICNEGKSVVAERFIRTLKQLCQILFFFYVLNNIVDKYNNTYHNIIKIVLILMLNAM